MSVVCELEMGQTDRQEAECEGASCQLVSAAEVGRMGSRGRGWGWGVDGQREDGGAELTFVVED